jgi:hypothetical protein
LPIKYLGKNIDFNMVGIFEECIGHCIVFYNREKSILGIYDVCIHEHVAKIKPPKTNFLESIIKSKGVVLLDKFTNFIENSGITFGYYIDNTPENNNLYSGWGSILIDTLINSFIRFPANTIICLTVDINNSIFEGAANLYIKYGFKNPYLTNYDFLQFEFPNTLLVALSRQNFIDEYPTREERHEVYKNLLYVLEENKKCLEGKDNCSLSFKFNENVIKTLIRLPYVYYNYNSDGTNNYDNYRGILKFEKIDYNELIKEFVWEIEIDNNTIQNNEGGIVSFVSHSYSSMLKDIRNSFPSGEDYAKLVELFLKYGTICYFVIVIEGIFIISFKKSVKNITVEMIPFIITNYTLTEIKGDININDYLNKVNSLEIFDSQYLSWEAIFSNKITINYPFFNNQCYPLIDTKRMIERLHNIYGHTNFVKI